ncbi:MAG: MotA/TolQ/ExbB proton channel family protein [Capsulimonas sp.]|uniref:MotA/TolQ/ExbB proton channel family protein n=1 Tax=Capsulimonas sp. TaxID=2494211 RepID=UPI003266B0A5
MFVHGLQFLLRGGPVMWPLLACAILSVTVMIERAGALRRALAGADLLIARVMEQMHDGRDDEALELARSHHGPVGRVLAHAITRRHRDVAAIERSLEVLAQEETPKVTQRLGILDTVITVSPLLGLLGTVTGMIKAFHVVADPSSLNGPSMITGGVGEALIATATGLAIAIVTLVGYNALGEQARAVVRAMERGATQAVELIANRQSKETEYEDVIA